MKWIGFGYTHVDNLISPEMPSTVLTNVKDEKMRRFFIETKASFKKTTTTFV